MDIKRIKDYGDNSITPVPIFSTGYINPSPIPSSKQYNPVGAIVDPNNIGISIELNESVPDGIHVAGIYEITIQISDEAGNINSKIINFKVVPKNIVIDCITNPGAWVCKPYCEKFPTAPACQPFCTANPTDPSCILPGFIDPVLVKLEDPTDSYSSGSTILPNDIIYTLSGGT